MRGATDDRKRNNNNQDMFRNQDDTLRLHCGYCSNDGQWSSGALGQMDVASEDQLVKDLNELSMEERGRILEEIHGVGDIRDESPEFIDACLKEFDKFISIIPRSRRGALDRAFFLRPGLKSDVKFKLMFLRSEMYDAEKAANRMAMFFTFKLDLFGEEKLTKKITLDDLDEKTIQVLSTGPAIELPYTDQSGRPIVFLNLDKVKCGELACSTLRCFWYVVMNAMDNGDITPQMKGITRVGYCSVDVKDKFIPHLRDFILQIGQIVKSLPVRLSCLHICCNVQGDGSWLHMLTNVVCAAIGKRGRVRLRTHFGSDLELQYALRTFGIDCGIALEAERTPGGKGPREAALEYLNRRREIDRVETEDVEREEVKSGVILYPKPKDVAMGRGKPFRDFHGNQFWAQLINDNMERYLSCPDKFSKTCLSLEIVQTVQERGGRFIQQKGDGWHVLDDAVARDKTLRAFRPRIASNVGGGGGTSISRSTARSQTVLHNPAAKRMKYDSEATSSS